MKRALIVATGLLIFAGIDWLVPIEHHGAFWQHWPGGYGLFGFLVCLLIIIVAKSLGTILLKDADQGGQND